VLLASIRAELKTQVEAAGGASSSLYGADPSKVQALKLALEDGANPAEALDGSAAPTLVQLLVDWFGALPDDVWANCRSALHQLMHSPPPAEEQAELLILLAHLPELERELVLWVLHLLHELTLPSERVTNHSQGSQQMILSSAFRMLAPHLLLLRADVEASAQNAHLFLGHDACRFLERLLKVYSFLLIDSLLVPPSFALLVDALPLELPILLPALSRRAQRLARLSAVVLPHCGSGATNFSAHQVQVPSTAHELLRLVVNGNGACAALSTETEGIDGRVFNEEAQLDDAQLDDMLQELQIGELALLRFGADVLLYRTELKLSLSWQAELPWQSLLLVETHSARGGGIPKQTYSELHLPLSHKDVLCTALVRGLRDVSIEPADVFLHPRVEREFIRIDYDANYCNLPVVRSTRVVRGVLNASASATVMQPAFCCSNASHAVARRRWLAWWHPAELLAATQSQLCIAADEQRRFAGAHEWSHLLRRSLPDGSRGSHHVPCVCVGRPDEGLTTKMEAAVGDACARLATQFPCLWNIALAKYRAVAEMPAGGRLLCINAFRSDGSCLPPVFCLLPLAGSEGYIPAAARPALSRSRQQLVDVLHAAVPNVLLHHDSFASTLAAAASTGAAAAAAVAAAAVSPIELVELHGGAWGAPEFMGSDAVLANTLEALLMQESVECSVRSTASSTIDEVRDVFGDAAMVLDEVLGGALVQLVQRSAVLTKCSLFEFYELQPRLQALVTSHAASERQDIALDRSCRGLLDSLAVASPGWPLPANAKGWASLQHGDLQAAHVLVDVRQHYWFLRCSYSAGPGHVLKDAAHLCASSLFLGTVLPLSRADLYSPPPRQLAAQLGIGDSEAHLVQRLLARTSSLEALQRAVVESSLARRIQTRVLQRIGSDQERQDALEQAKLLVDWIASMPPFGSHVYDTPRLAGVLLPSIERAFSYLQQFWNAAASLCCPTGNMAASAVPVPNVTFGRQDASTPRVQDSWRHPAQMVLPLLSNAARMSACLEASMPQREWMLYAVRRFADALSMCISYSSMDSVTPAPLHWRGCAAASRQCDECGGAQLSCPFGSGQRLLVLRASQISGQTTLAWEAGEVDDAGRLVLTSSPLQPLSLNPLATDFWEAPDPWYYTRGETILLLSECGWEEWKINSCEARHMNLFELRHGGSPAEAQEVRRVVLTPFNHRLSNGAWPSCRYQHRYSKYQLLRGMRAGKWRRVLSLGHDTEGNCLVRLVWGDAWADRPLNVLQAHAPLLNDQIDIDAEHVKYCNALQSDWLPGGVSLPIPLRGLHLDVMSFAFSMREPPEIDGASQLGHSTCPGSERLREVKCSVGSDCWLDVLLQRLLQRTLAVGAGEEAGVQQNVHAQGEAPQQHSPKSSDDAVVQPPNPASCAVVVVGEAGSGKSMLCRAVICHALRGTGGTDKLVPLLVSAADVAEAVRSGKIQPGEDGALLLQWLRHIHGMHSRRFILLKQALVEGRLLLLLDGLAIRPLEEGNVYSRHDAYHKAMLALEQEVAGLFARSCGLLVTARPGGFNEAFFPSSIFMRVELAPQPSAVLRALSVVLTASQQLALWRFCAQPWAEKLLQRPLISALFVAIHAKRSADAAPLRRVEFLVDALDHMLQAGRMPVDGSSAQLRVHVLKCIALCAFQLRSRRITASIIKQALGHSPGALMLWQQLQEESWSGQLPLLVGDGYDCIQACNFDFCADCFADILLALSFRELSVSELMRPNMAMLLTPPDVRIKRSVSGEEAVLSYSVRPQQAAQWAWPEGGCSSLLTVGYDTLLYVEEHAMLSGDAGMFWLRAFTDAVTGEAVRAHSEPHVDLTKLAVLLRYSRSLRGVQLVNCHLDDHAAEQLANALGRIEETSRGRLQLESLHLGSNDIGPKGATLLAQAIPTTVKLLGLEGNQIGDEGAASFASLLQVNTSLISLDLASNDIGDLGVLRLLDGLASNRALEQLSLRGNPCDPARHAPALEPRFALLEGDTMPVKARVVF